jgi:hypothetical protein
MHNYFYHEKGEDSENKFAQYRSEGGDSTTILIFTQNFTNDQSTMIISTFWSLYFKKYYFDH